MIMKKNRRIAMLGCITLVSIFLAAGCEKAPDRSQNTQTEDSVSLSSEKMVSVQEAKDQIAKIKGKNIDGLQFPENFVLPTGKEVYEVKLSPWYTKDKKEMEDMIASLWNDYQKVDWSSVPEDSFPRKDKPNYYAVSKQDEESGRMYSFDAGGFFCGNSMNDTELHMDRCVKQYDFEWGDTASDKDEYELQDGKLSVPEAVAYTEKQLNTYLHPFEKKQFTYKVQHLYVKKDPENGHYDYDMVVGRVYRGGVIDTCSDFYLSEGKYYPYTHCGIEIEATMCHKNSLDMISTGAECLDVASNKKYDKIISPLWAVQRIKNEIAHIGGLSFQECGLLYLLVQDNRLAKEKDQDVYQGVDDNTYLRPVWAFMTEDRGISDGMRTSDVHGTSVVVDAIDGNLYYYEGTGGY